MQFCSDHNFFENIKISLISSDFHLTDLTFNVVFTNLNCHVQNVCSLCFGWWMHLELQMLDARCTRSFLHRVTEG